MQTEAVQAPEAVQTPPATAPVAQPPTQDVGSMPKVVTSQADIAAIDDQLFGDAPIALEPTAPVQIPVAAPVTPPAAPVAVVPPPQAQPAAPVTPVPAPVEPVAPTEEPGKEKILPGRIGTSQFSPEEKEAIALRVELEKAGEPVPPLLDRLQIVRDRRATATAAQAAETAALEAQLNAPVVPSQSETISQELATLDAQYNEAIALENIAEIAKLGRQITDTTLRLERARSADQAQEDAFQRSVQEGRTAARTAAIGMFPSTADASTPLGSRVQQLMTAMRNPNHPDHNTLLTVNAAVTVATTAAVQLASEMAAGGTMTFESALASLRGTPAAAAPAAPAAVPAHKVTPTQPVAAPVATPARVPVGDPKSYNEKETDEALFGTAKPPGMMIRIG